MTELANHLKDNTVFIVKNINAEGKVINIFSYPILPGDTRDILAIPGISEADIRASLLKGELLFKIKAKDILIISSDIDLIQFNEDQKKFLQDAGVIFGVEVASKYDSIPYIIKENVEPIGIKDGNNRYFYTPDKFLNGLLPSGDKVHIYIQHNGRTLYEGMDYSIAESNGPGTGYDTIIFNSLIPIKESVIIVNYYVKK